MGKMLTNKPPTKKRGKRKNKFNNADFELPSDGSYIHSTSRTFHRQLANLTIVSLFEEMMKPFLDIIEEQKSLSLKQFQEIKNPQEFLEYFSPKNNAPLNDLRQIKNFLTLIRTARTKVSTKYEQAMAVRTKNNEIHFSVPGYKPAPRKAAKRNMIEYLMAGGGTIFTVEGLADIDKLVDFILDTAETTIGVRVGQFNSKSLQTDSTAAQQAYIKFQEHLKIWSSDQFSGYRTGNLKKLEDIHTFSQFLSASHSTLGYFAEVLTANNNSNSTIVGDTDNKNTASDLETTLKTVDDMEVKIGQSIKFLRTDVLSKEYLVTIDSIEQLVSTNLELYKQLNYFLTNYFILGHPRNSTTLYTALKNFLKKVYFITLVFKGSAYHNMVKRDDALPMLITINQKTIFTYQVWEALSSLVKNSGVSVEMHNWKDVNLPDAEEVLSSVKQKKKKLSQRLILEQKPLGYNEYMQDTELSSFMQQNMMFSKYKNLALGRIKVSVDMAKLIENQGGQ